MPPAIVFLGQPYTGKTSLVSHYIRAGVRAIAVAKSLAAKDGFATGAFLKSGKIPGESFYLRGKGKQLDHDFLSTALERYKDQPIIMDDVSCGGDLNALRHARRQVITVALHSDDETRTRRAEAEPHPHGLLVRPELEELIAGADHHVENDETLIELYQRGGQILRWYEFF